MQKKTLLKIAKSKYSASAPFIKVSNQILLKYYQRLAKRLSRKLAKTSVDNIHQMRVISRKIRVLFKHTCQFYPQDSCAVIRKGLRKFASKLGAIRDVDTFSEYLYSCKSIIPREYHRQLIQFRKDLKKIRGKKEEDFLHYLTKKSFKKFRNEMDYVIHYSKKPKNPMALQEELPILLNALLDTILVFKKLENADDEVLHSLRILFKHLRYMCEFFKKYYGSDLNDFFGDLSTAQEILGVIQDKERDISFLHNQLHEIWDIASSPDLDLLVKNLVKSMEKIKAIKRKEFLRFWRRFSSAGNIANIRAIFNKIEK